MSDRNRYEQEIDDFLAKKKSEMMSDLDVNNEISLSDTVSRARHISIQAALILACCLALVGTAALLRSVWITTSPQHPESLQRAEQPSGRTYTDEAASEWAPGEKPSVMPSEGAIEENSDLPSIQVRRSIEMEGQEIAAAPEGATMMPSDDGMVAPEEPAGEQLPATEPEGEQPPTSIAQRLPDGPGELLTP